MSRKYEEITVEEFFRRVEHFDSQRLLKTNSTASGKEDSDIAYKKAQRLSYNGSATSGCAKRGI